VLQKYPWCLDRATCWGEAHAVAVIAGLRRPSRPKGFGCTETMRGSPSASASRAASATHPAAQAAADPAPRRHGAVRDGDRCSRGLSRRHRHRAPRRSPERKPARRPNLAPTRSHSLRDGGHLFAIYNFAKLRFERALGLEAYWQRALEIRCATATPDAGGQPVVASQDIWVEPDDAGGIASKGLAISRAEQIGVAV